MSLRNIFQLDEANSGKSTAVAIIVPLFSDDIRFKAQGHELVN